MAFFEDRILTASIEIKTTPEKIFAFLTASIDDGSYRAWQARKSICAKKVKTQKKYSRPGHRRKRGSNGNPWRDDAVRRRYRQQNLAKAYQLGTDL